MMFKGMAIFAMILALAPAPALLSAQASNRPDSARPDTSVPAPLRPDSNGVPSEDQMPHFTVTLPAPIPAPWSLHDKILWGANIVLAFLGYAGIMVAVSTLKKIERSTAAVEDGLVAVQATANAASTAATAASCCR